jgi:hypothetical protein
MFFVNYLRNIRKECRTVYSGVIREVNVTTQHQIKNTTLT